MWIRFLITLVFKQNGDLNRLLTVLAGIDYIGEVFFQCSVYIRCVTHREGIQAQFFQQ